MIGDGHLRETLESARAQGFLGPGLVEAHFQHALGFVELIRNRDPEPSRILDLGTGGGVPGLVLADRLPSSAVVLLEASARRSTFLADAVAGLGWSGRVEVVALRGEDAARREDLREQFGVVTARSFAEPAVTAEIGAAFAAVGGALVVSEPPEGRRERWPGGHLEELGLGAAVAYEVGGAHFVVIEKTAPVAARYPRANGRPAKRPLW